MTHEEKQLMAAAQNVHMAHLVEQRAEVAAHAAHSAYILDTAGAGTYGEVQTAHQHMVLKEQVHARAVDDLEAALAGLIEAALLIPVVF